MRLTNLTLLLFWGCGLATETSRPVLDGARSLLDGAERPPVDHGALRKESLGVAGSACGLNLSETVHSEGGAAFPVIFQD